MRDFNFFSQYIYSTKKVSVKRFIIPAVLVVLIGAIGGTWFLLETKINHLQEDYDSNQGILESSEYVNTMEEIDAVRSHIEYLRALNEESVLFTLQMQDTYKVTDQLMSLILAATPQNVAYFNYAINGDAISISAVTTEYATIAEFETNLRALALFDSIIVTSIDPADDLEDGFSFNIDLAFPEFEIGGETVD